MDDAVSRWTTGQSVGEQTFDAYYFAHCCGVPYKRDAHWLTFFGAIADRILSDIQPRRVLDAGCALGILVETLRTRGVDAEGIDLSSYAIANVHEPIRPFCRLGSITEELPGRYDLIVTIEVLEHMAPRDGEAAIANFCRHTDDVLFSSTPIDHRELSHVNVQPGEYWGELFAQQGFYRDVDFDASFLTPWAVRFRRGRDPLPRIVRDYERRYVALAAMRNDARAFSTDLQRQLAELLPRVTALEAARDQLAAERDQLAAARDQVAADRDQVAADRDRVAADRDRATEGERAATAALQRVTADLTNLAQALEQERAAAVARLEAVGLERDELARRLEAETRSVAALRDAVEQGDANLTRKVVALGAAEERAASLDHAVAHARQTIHLMETSLFWRARRLWVPIARALGRST